MPENTDMEGALLGCGNPLLDIMADVPISFLEKYGLKLDNAILASDEHVALYKELVENFKVEYVAGGATQNTIRVAQWVLNIPKSTAYIGSVGKDEFSKRLVEAAEADGVSVHYQENDEQPTGTCACLINEGERSLVAYLAAANLYNLDHMQQLHIQAIIERARVAFVGGFFLTVCPEAAKLVGKKMAEAGKIFAMNLSAPFIVSVFGERLEECLPYCDFVFGNETEGLAMGEKYGWGEDLHAIALKITELPKAESKRKRVCVITQGEKATIVAKDGQTKEYSVSPLTKEELVDTTGAGDAFVGGFLAQLLKERDIEECVKAGHWAARLIIQESGCKIPSQLKYEE